MLDALLHGKLRGLLREAMRTDKMPELQEDLITSTIFGPLKFMSTRAAWQAVQWILPNESTFARGFEPFQHEPFFWPSLRNKGSRVEPDLVVTFKSEDGQRRILVMEVKWNAPLGDHQLANQKGAAHECYPGAPITQVLISKFPAISENALAQIEGTGCLATSWHHIVSLAAADLDEDIRQWAALARELLQALGLVPFVGFRAPSPILSTIPVLAWTIGAWRFNVTEWMPALTSSAVERIKEWRLCK